MRSRLCIFITVGALCSTADAGAVVQKISESPPLYAGIGENAILLLLGTQLLTFVWHMGKWIVDKYFREQHDKDAEVKKLKAEFHEFREEVAGFLTEIKTEMKHLGRLPDEEKIMHRLSERMEFMVYKAAKELGIKNR